MQGFTKGSKVSQVGYAGTFEVVGDWRGYVVLRSELGTEHKAPAGELELVDALECEGHPAGEFDPMGETVYCDGSCRTDDRRPDGPAVHTFGSSREAYTASQTRDAIRNGDVLEVPSENVVGILVGAWPTAVTPYTGEFHRLADDVEWSAVPRDTWAGVPVAEDYSPSYELAKHVAGTLRGVLYDVLAEGNELAKAADELGIELPSSRVDEDAALAIAVDELGIELPGRTWPTDDELRASGRDPDTGLVRDEELRELAAEYEVLDDFDTQRRIAGHDYGAGQRHAELVRRRRELRARGVDVELVQVDLAPAEIAAAFERVARPRIARIERENYRRSTPSTVRTLDTWRRQERRTTYGLVVELDSHPSSKRVDELPGRPGGPGIRLVGEPRPEGTGVRAERVYDGRCNACGDEWQELTPPAICPECHSLDVVDVTAEPNERGRE